MPETDTGGSANSETVADDDPEIGESPESEPDTAGVSRETPEPDTAGVSDLTPEPDTFPRAYVEQLRSENARYRQRAGRADELARRLLETTVRSAAADHLADPGDLLVFADEADLLDDDGYPDADRIIDAAKVLAGERPHLAPRRARGDIGQGATPAADEVNLAGILRERAS